MALDKIMLQQEIEKNGKGLCVNEIADATQMDGQKVFITGWPRLCHFCLDQDGKSHINKNKKNNNTIPA